MDDFIVSGSYNGYVYIGNAQGNFQPDGGGEKRPYFNMYVLSPVSGFQSEDYMAFGFKAEKLKCIGPEVWQGLEIGEQVKLFFDDKKRVQMAASEGLPPFKKAAPDKPKDGKATE